MSTTAGGGSGKDIKAPKFSKDYEEGIKIAMKYLPQQLAQEYAMRQQYDPAYIEQALGLQQTYDPRLAQEQKLALFRRDPEWYATHVGLGNKIQQALARGYVDPNRQAAYQALGQQVTGDTLRGQTADPVALHQMTQAILSRSPSLSYGEAQDMAAAVYTGQRGQALQQQRQVATNQFLGQQSEAGQALAQAGSYLSSPTVMSQINQIQGVTPPSANRYVNPNAGYQGAQYGLQNYQNQLAQQQTQGGGNPWMNALQGAGQGAQMGSAFGGYGALIGAGAGAIYGAYSDERLKADIVKVGEHNGLDVIEFRYRKGKTRYRGVSAQQVQEKFPDAVGLKDGFLTVDYAKIGMPMERWCKRCERFKPMESFQKNARARDGRTYICAECWDDNFRSYRVNYRRKNLEHLRAYKTTLLLKCDMPTAIRLNIARSMQKECDICGRPPNKHGLVHDHCHKSGKLRGLICRDCNTALGLFKDDPLVLRKAIQHLEKDGWEVARKEVQ